MSHGAGELMKCFAEYVTFQADLRKNLAFFFFFLQDDRRWPPPTVFKEIWYQEDDLPC